MKFSVLMSVYSKDRPDYLDIALKSIWDDQILKPDEIVLIKDGPLNDSLDIIINKWKNKLNKILNIITLEANVGLGKALNKGLKYCKNNIVARMDADDISLPKRFLMQIDFFKHNSEVDILGGWGHIIDNNKIIKNERTQPRSDKEIKKILWACPIIHCSVMYRKDSILKVGSYNPNLARRQEDYELWIRAGFNGLIFSNIQDYLIKYRSNVTKNTISVSYNRAKIGFKAVRYFDPRLISYFAMIYPLFRSLMPFRLGQLIETYFTNSRFDPRKGVN